MSFMDDETRKRIEDLEQRLKKVEGILFAKGSTPAKQVAKGYRGLAGGIRYLIDNSFLNQPRTANDVMAELKREGYHHSLASVSKMLSVDFTKNKKILNRIKEGGKWKYVIRK